MARSRISSVPTRSARSTQGQLERHADVTRRQELLGGGSQGCPRLRRRERDRLRDRETAPHAGRDALGQLAHLLVERAHVGLCLPLTGETQGDHGPDSAGGGSRRPTDEPAEARPEPRPRTPSPQHVRRPRTRGEAGASRPPAERDLPEDSRCVERTRARCARVRNATRRSRARWESTRTRPVSIATRGLRPADARCPAICRWPLLRGLGRPRRHVIGKDVSAGAAPSGHEGGTHRRPNGRDPPAPPWDRSTSFTAPPTRPSIASHSRHDASSVASADRVDDDVECGRDLLAHVRCGKVDVGHERHGLEPPERVLGRVRVCRRHRSLVSRIHGLEHVERLATAHLAHDDPIRSHAERVADERSDGHLAVALDVGRPRLEGDRRVVAGDGARPRPRW